MTKDEVIKTIDETLLKSISRNGAAVAIYEKLTSLGIISYPEQYFKPQAVAAAVTEVFGINPCEKTREPDHVIARKVYALFLLRHSNMKLTAIATELGLVNDDGKPDHASIIYYRNWIGDNKNKVQRYIDEMYMALDKNKSNQCQTPSSRK